MTELFEYIAKLRVNNPDEVSVEEGLVGRTTIIELRVAASDLGQVIGRQGRTARALRAVLAAAATREDRRAVLEIVE